MYFSRVKLMMTDYRKKLSPSIFESQMFLMMHKAFWTHFWKFCKFKFLNKLVLSAIISIIDFLEVRNYIIDFCGLIFKYIE